MPRPQDIQDLKDHREATTGEHNITEVASPGAVPLAGADGKLDNAWLSDTVVTTEGGGTGDDGRIPVAVLPDTVVQLVNGKIPNALLENTVSGKVFQSNKDGSASQGTGFLLSNGQDLRTYILAQDTGYNSHANATGTVSDCGDYQCRTSGVSLGASGRQIILYQNVYRYNCSDCSGP